MCEGGKCLACLERGACVFTHDDFHVIFEKIKEADGLVLVDYKTDYVQKGQEELLLKKYQTQLDYYRKALGRITGKPVRETWIYSFGLGKALAVPEDEN